MVAQKKECKSLVRWKQSFDLDEKNWRIYCSVAFNCTIDVDLRWFQFKIVHKILYTNDLLFRLKLVDSKECSFCKSHPETVLHLFCECYCSKIIWSKLEEWIFRKTGNRLKFEKENIVFGFKGPHNDALNCIIIVVKKVIYSNRFQNKLPIFVKCKSAIIDYYKKEKYVADSNCKGFNFDKKWFNLKNMLCIEK